MVGEKMETKLISKKKKEMEPWQKEVAEFLVVVRDDMNSLLPNVRDLLRAYSDPVAFAYALKAMNTKTDPGEVLITNILENLAMKDEVNLEIEYVDDLIDEDEEE
ncbi:MAG: hypothetical protein ACTSPB_03240 [Candidatus Thorarchaeota archaeon]